MQNRTLIVISDRIDAAPGERPRRDHEELTRALDADVLHAGDADAALGRGRGGIALARTAAARAAAYENIYCDSEHVGLPLAFLLRKNTARPRLTMIAHYLSPLKKRVAIRFLRLPARFQTIVLHSEAQMQRARSLGFSDQQLALIPYQVDSKFWRPQTGRPTTYIASAGQEFRDYRTLMRAVSDVPVQVRIAAGSHWSSRRNNFGKGDIPRNVAVTSLSYRELRESYAGAHFVVVPLHDVDFQAGIITILEAMAMGKCVVVSQTRGQSGVVSGPLMRDGRLQDIGENAWHDRTGIYVPPGDDAALRQTITYLLDRPDVARRMGEAGRAFIESHLSLDHFVERMSAVIAPATIPELAGARS